jgi:hypothetical protein
MNHGFADSFTSFLQRGEFGRAEFGWGVDFEGINKQAGTGKGKNSQIHTSASVSATILQTAELPVQGSHKATDNQGTIAMHAALDTILGSPGSQDMARVEIPDSPDSAALAGRLDAIAIMDICQLLRHSMGTAYIEAEGVQGIIGFDGTGVSAAHWGAFEGREAYLEMALLLEGKFLFDDSEAPPPRNVWIRTEHLLFEGAVYLDHWAELWDADLGPRTPLCRKGGNDGLGEPVHAALWNEFREPCTAADGVWRLADQGFDRIDLVKALADLHRQDLVEPYEGQPQAIPLRPRGFLAKERGAMRGMGQMGILGAD